jgi:uncharacterized protein (TIGR00251 family)
MRIRVRVHPRASRNRVVRHPDDTLEAWLTAPPVEGAANTALCQLLAEALGLPARTVVVVQGARSRHKVVELPLDVAGLRRALPPA